MESQSMGVAVAGEEAGQPCACGAGEKAGGPVAAREVLRATATGLGFTADEQVALLGAMDNGDCGTTRDLLAARVAALVAVAQERVVGSIGETAATQRTSSPDTIGMPPAVADLHHRIVAGLDRLARLQAAAVLLSAEPAIGACSVQCPCTRAIEALASSPEVPQRDVGLTLAPASGLGPAIACTLDGGIDAMQARVGDWQEVVGLAIGRRPVAGGVTLMYGHGERLAVDLARLAAAEYACCSFFTFSLTVGPTGMAFTVTAPPEAGDVVTAMFGAYGTAGTEGAA